MHKLFRRQASPNSRLYMFDALAAQEKVMGSQSFVGAHRIVGHAPST